VEDGTEFGARFVVIDDLVPDVLRPVANEIVQAGSYLYMMKTQGADLRLLVCQMNLDGDIFRSKSLGEVREVIRQIHKQSSANVLRHLDAKFGVRSFSVYLQRVYLAHHTNWMEELVRLYEERKIADLITTKQTSPQMLQQLLDDASGSDWVGSDAFRRRFQLNVSDHHYYPQIVHCADDSDCDEVVKVKQLDLQIVNDYARNLAFPAKVIESYRHIFRISFLLRRARYLLVNMRFNTSPSRHESSTQQLMIRFVQSYIAFLFGHISSASEKFVEELPQVEGLADLVGKQLDFHCNLGDRALLDMERKDLMEAIISIVVVFSSYARGEIPFDKLNARVGLRICKLKRMLLRDDGFASLRNSLFGSNFANISTNEADLEPLWESLRHFDQS